MHNLFLFCAGTRSMRANWDSFHLWCVNGSIKRSVGTRIVLSASILRAAWVIRGIQDADSSDETFAFIFLCGKEYDPKRNLRPIPRPWKPAQLLLERSGRRSHRCLQCLDKKYTNSNINKTKNPAPRKLGNHTREITTCFKEQGKRGTKGENNKSCMHLLAFGDGLSRNLNHDRDMLGRWQRGW